MVLRLYFNMCPARRLWTRPYNPIKIIKQRPDRYKC